MTKVALYARYSSDNQSVASIEDQFRICREQAAREKWKVVGTYHDAAISGASVILRPGIQSLLQDAQRGKFEIVLAEALDRVSRDQADVATLFKHLRFAGVQIVTLSEGEISELHVGLKGTMNALFLKDLAAKTHRGIRGRVEKGKSGGGLCYGYDVVKHTDAEGEPIRGERTVNEAQAEIVRRVFRAFAAGISPRAIARRLNEEGIPGPDGALWTDSTLRGHAARGTGLINNELYIGKLVWNRLRYIKDPATGRRVSRLNPRDKWITTEVPELRIVDDELWQAAKARQGELAVKYANVITATRAAHANRLNGTHRPRSLLSGLLVCGCCGGPYALARPGSLCLFQPRHERLLLQQPQHHPRGAGSPHAGRAARAAHGAGDRRRGHARLCGRDQPSQPRAPRRQRDRPESPRPMSKRSSRRSSPPSRTAATAGRS